MQSRTLMSPVLGVAFFALSAITSLQAQSTPTVFYACYTRIGGVVYRIKEPLLQPPILRERCASADHVQFSWTSGVADHGLMTGLLDDDHTQYLLGNGTRALTGNLSLGGFVLTNLGAASANGQAVRFEQAVKTTDPAGGDVTGSFANLDVVGLRSRPLSTTAPTSGQVLTFNGTAWAPAAPPSGGGVTVHGQLSGLEADNHPQYVLADGTRPLTSLTVHGSGNFSGELLVNSGLTTIPADGGIISFGALGVGSVPGGDGVRIMWYPGKAAFRVGGTEAGEWENPSIGEWSVAMGRSTTASGQSSTAMGRNTKASGSFSTALGRSTTASGSFSTALGDQTTASGGTSTALGWGTTASGEFSTALGAGTTASGYRSTALGNLANTNGKSGSFVYGDASSAILVTASADNQFVVRAAGGTIFYSNSATTAGVQLAAGGGAWASVSDRQRKENFHDEDGERVLAQIAHMPLQSWNYKAQAPGIRHLGPTAQDFYAAFQLGESDTTINTVDADGINLLAVQALERRTAELRRENEELRAAVARLETIVRALVEARKE